jgi:hypothetical protein
LGAWGMSVSNIKKIFTFVVIFMLIDNINAQKLEKTFVRMKKGDSKLVFMESEASILIYTENTDGKNSYNVSVVKENDGVSSFVDINGFRSLSFEILKDKRSFIHSFKDGEKTIMISDNNGDGLPDQKTIITNNSVKVFKVKKIIWEEKK